MPLLYFTQPVKKLTTDTHDLFNASNIHTNGKARSQYQLPE